jgi:hypothetical protein
MKKFSIISDLLVCLVVCVAPLALGSEAEPPIDTARGRALMQKASRGETQESFSAWLLSTMSD